MKVIDAITSEPIADSGAAFKRGIAIVGRRVAMAVIVTGLAIATTLGLGKHGAPAPEAKIEQLVAAPVIETVPEAQPEPPVVKLKPKPKPEAKKSKAKQQSKRVADRRREASSRE